MRKIFGAHKIFIALVAVATLAQAQTVVPPFKTSQFNGEIMVDGITYNNLAAAWAAAVSLASSTGHNQVVNLGAGVYTLDLTTPSAAGEPAYLGEPNNGTCVSLIGSTAPSQAEDTEYSGTTINVDYLAGTNGEILVDGASTNTTTPPTNCTFKNLNIVVNSTSPIKMGYAFYFPGVYGLNISNVSINDFIAPTSMGPIAIGFSNTSTSLSTFYLHNVVVSNNPAYVTPASRMVYGVYLGQYAKDSVIDGLVVRNAMTAALYNGGTGITVRSLHGFGYPYTCTTAPCNNQDTSSTDAAASWASSYVVEDMGGGGNVYADTYMDSPAVAAFDLGVNGVVINGGNLYWPDDTSFPNANLATVQSTFTSNLVIDDIACNGMNPTQAGIPTSPAGATGVWISYLLTNGDAPANSTVFGLSGCQDFYANRMNARQSVFDTGGNNSSNTNFGPGVAGETPKVLVFPLNAQANEGNEESECFSGPDTSTGDIYYGGEPSQPSSFAVRCNGTIHSAGGLQTSAVSETASTALAYTNKNVMADASAGAITLTLPSCYTPMPDGLTPTGMEMTVYKTDSSANAVTLDTTSSETITYNGTSYASGALSLGSSLHELTLVCGADSNWYAH